MSTIEVPRVARDRVPLAAGIDTAAVVLFVAIGRRSHDEDPGIGGLVTTAAPFLIALAIAWLLFRAWKRPVAVVTGVQLWLGTVALGMVLRRLVFDDGTALAFVIVAACFLGLFIVGWRAVAVATLRRRGTP